MDPVAPPSIHVPPPTTIAFNQPEVVSADAFDGADPTSYAKHYMESCETWCTYKPSPVSEVEDYFYPRIIRSRTISNNSLKVKVYSATESPTERTSSKSDDVYFSCEEDNNEDNAFTPSPRPEQIENDSERNKNDTFQYSYVALYRKPVQSEPTPVSDYIDLELISLGSSSSHSTASDSSIPQKKTFCRSYSAKPPDTKDSDGYEIPMELGMQYRKKKLRRGCSTELPFKERTIEAMTKEPILYENSMISFEPRKSKPPNHLSSSAVNLSVSEGQPDARRTLSCGAIPALEPTCVRKISLHNIRSEDNESTSMQIMRFNNNVWLAEASETFTPGMSSFSPTRDVHKNYYPTPSYYSVQFHVYRL